VPHLLKVLLGNSVVELFYECDQLKIEIRFKLLLTKGSRSELCIIVRKVLGLEDDLHARVPRSTNVQPEWWEFAGNEHVLIPDHASSNQRAGSKRTIHLSLWFKAVVQPHVGSTTLPMIYARQGAFSLRGNCARTANTLHTTQHPLPEVNLESGKSSDIEAVRHSPTRNGLGFCHLRIKQSISTFAVANSKSRIRLHRRFTSLQNCHIHHALCGYHFFDRIWIGYINSRCHLYLRTTFSWRRAHPVLL
jgi:hypothetical protein